MTRLSWACYSLAVAGLASSYWAGWPVAVVAVAALAAAVALAALEHLRAAADAGTTQALTESRQEAAAAREEVKRLRTEVQAALARQSQPRGY